jgi:hypothetical protein
MGIRDFIRHLEEHQVKLERGPELSESERQEILLSDTVGFIDRLPHSLVAAFRATFLRGLTRLPVVF